MIDLNEYKKQNPFQVPEGYFDDLQKKVMQTIHDENVNNIHVNKNHRRYYWIPISAAASIALIVMVLFFYSHNSAPSTMLTVATPASSLSHSIESEPSISVDQAINTESSSNAISPKRISSSSNNPNLQSIDKELAHNNSNSSTLEPATESVDEQISRQITYSVIQIYADDAASNLYCEVLDDLDFCYEY